MKDGWKIQGINLKLAFLYANILMYRYFLTDWVDMILDTLKAVIARRGISIAELARRIGMDPQLLSARLHGKAKISSEELILLAHELEISLDELSTNYFEQKQEEQKKEAVNA